MTKEIQKIELTFSRAKMALENPLELGEYYLIAGKAQCVQKRENDNQDGSLDLIYTLRFEPESFKIEK